MSLINNNYANIGHVKVEKWGEKKPDNNEALNNDCYWNIASNTLDVGATNEEITQVMNEMIELNASVDSNGNFDTNLEVNDVILLPMEQTISQADNEIKQVLESKQTNENQKTELMNLKNSLEELGEEYNKKDSINDEQKQQYQKMLDSIDKELENLTQKEVKIPQEAQEAQETSIEQKNNDEINKENDDTINLLAKELYNATAGRLGTADEFVESIMENLSDENFVKIMDSYKSVSGSEIYKDIKNDFSGKTQEKYLNRLDNAYKNVKNEEYMGWNDGKLSIEESVGAFCNKIKDNTINFVKKNGVGLVAGAAVGAAAVATGVLASVAAVPAGAAALVGIGVVAAGTGIVKGIKTIGNFFKHTDELKNAKTDDEAKQSFENYADDAGNALDSGLSVFGGVQVAKMGVSGIKAVKTRTKAIQSVKSAMEGAKGAKDIAQADKSLKGLVKGISTLILGGSGLSKVAMDGAGTILQAAGGALAGPKQKKDEQNNIQLAQNEPKAPKDEQAGDKDVRPDRKTPER